MNYTRASKFRLLLCVGFLSFFNLGSANTMVTIFAGGTFVLVGPTNPFGFDPTQPSPNGLSWGPYLSYTAKLNFTLSTSLDQIASDLQQGNSPCYAISESSGSITANGVTYNFDSPISMGASVQGSWYPDPLNRPTLLVSAGGRSGDHPFGIFFYAPIYQLDDPSVSHLYAPGFTRAEGCLTDTEGISVSYESVPDLASSATLLMTSLVTLGLFRRYRLQYSA